MSAQRATSSSTFGPLSGASRTVCLRLMPENTALNNSNRITLRKQFFLWDERSFDNGWFAFHKRASVRLCHIQIVQGYMLTRLNPQGSIYLRDFHRLMGTHDLIQNEGHLKPRLRAARIYSVSELSIKPFHLNGTNVFMNPDAPGNLSLTLDSRPGSGC